ncbi:MAG: polysaccharide biosynthesis protein [Flavobacteriales bacterium]|nr:polysaccharide biosynthesis protein [Flavobacteriales bacterium]
MLFPNQNVPRWIIFLIDTCIVFFSFFAAYMLRFEFSLPQREVMPLLLAMPVFMIIRIISFLIGRTYAGIIRYTGTEDSVRIIKVIAAGSLLMALLNPLKFFLLDGYYFLPFSIIIIEAMISAVLLIAFRLGVKMLYLELRNPRSERERVIIYGAGEAGIITKRTIDRDAGTKYTAYAFIDDNRGKRGKRMEGAPIFHTDELADLLENEEIAHIILSIQHPESENRRRVIDTALQHQTDVLSVPPANNWINGELSFKQMRQVAIDDLLGRDVISLDDGNVEKQLRGKTILVTGAAGSIGSGLVRQVARYNPGRLVILDQAESPVYDLENELRNDFPALELEVVIGDIRQRERMENVFRSFRPEVVYHAAAYKHVPLMELNPGEAVFTNVLGTKNMTDLAVEYEVEAFVLISTDKAVNPTSVMGATKRTAEIYAQASNARGKTKFITTRFGNVLGSNGSVIPLFKKQIEAGGPVTVTHPEVTRFFMTIPEACGLVLEAGAMGEGSEIFVFDMGDSVKIIDLARQMITLSGFEVGKDMEIKITGLRPGEKLYEELLNDAENTLHTHHPRIKRAQVRPNIFTEVAEQTEALIALFHSQDNAGMVQKMKSIVPEFKSMNSEFSKFDA